MKRISHCLVMLVLLILILSPYSCLSAPKGIDAKKIREPELKVYPVTLTIGDMTFSGTLSRMDKVDDEEIKKAIKDSLKETGMTELELKEAQDAADRAQKAEDLTQEDIDRVMDNLMKLAGVDSIAALIKAIGNANADDFAQTLEGYAADETKEKALEWLLDQAAAGVEGAGEAAGPITKLLDTLVISADQSDRDAQKWETRVAGANAQRKLNDFYYKLNYRLDAIRGSRSHGWALKIEDHQDHFFDFFTTEDNQQTWNLSLILKKYDTKENTMATGAYTGLAIFTVQYSMDPFDRGFADWAINKSGMLDAQKASWEKRKGMGVISSYDISYSEDEYQKTSFSRMLDKSECTLSLAVPVAKGQSMKQKIDLSNFTDTKEAAIHHALNYTMSSTGKTVYDMNMTADYTAHDENAMEKIFRGTSSMTVKGKTIVGPMDSPAILIPFDASLWGLWEEEKWLEIKYP